jgi:hypothetical protein
MKKNVYAILVFAALIIVVLSIMKQRSHTVEKQLGALVKEFSSCLPPDLSEKQKGEVEQLLKRFHRASSLGIVARKDRDDVLQTLRHYVQKGEIDKKELSIFMAKVSYYTFRQSPENRDETGRMKAPDHPLLQHPSGEQDTM